MNTVRGWRSQPGRLAIWPINVEAPLVTPADTLLQSKRPSGGRCGRDRTENDAEGDPAPDSAVNRLLFCQLPGSREPEFCRVADEPGPEVQRDGVRPRRRGL